MKTHIAKTQSEQMLEIRNKFTGKNGHEYTIDELVDFAVANDYWKIDIAGTKRQLAAQLRRALNSEEVTDPQGRKVRRNYAAGVRRHGRQLYLWTDMAHASREHMKVALYDNRRRIFGACLRLNEYVESFNENHNSGKPIQMSFDFDPDIREAKLGKAKIKPIPKNRASVSEPRVLRSRVAARGIASRPSPVHP